MIEIESLKLLQPLEGMSENHLKKLQPTCEALKFVNGAKLFTEGDSAEHLWMVSEGAVDLRFELPDKRPTADDMTVDHIEVEKKKPEAKVLGWSCFVPPFKMRLSAYCVSEHCNIVRVQKSDLMRLFSEDALMGYIFMSNLIKVVAFRFHQFQKHVSINMGEDLMFGW